MICTDIELDYGEIVKIFARRNMRRLFFMKLVEWPDGPIDYSLPFIILYIFASRERLVYNE